MRAGTKSGEWSSTHSRSGWNLKREVQEFYWNNRVTSEILELRNLVETASLIVECAIRRHESRGLHYTLDYPTTDDARELHDTALRRY